MRFPNLSCRFCQSRDLAEILDLGTQPLANALVAKERLLEPEAHYPLVVLHCGQCGLVQVPAVASEREIFADYLYFSSYAESWLAHAQRYVEAVTARFGLGPRSQIVELASNDGYLLQYVIERGIPALGIEPAANVAAVARAKGIDTLVAFFTLELAQKLAAQERSADLIVANNVLAHVPQLNDFVAGMRHLLKPEGVATIEFPHVLRLVAGMQFDTIYHEHYSYYSLGTCERILAAHGLRIFDVETLPTHGGSLRLYACRAEAAHQTSPSLARLKQIERDGGWDRREVYLEFGRKVYALKRDLLEFFIAAKRQGRSLAAYGAAAKGNTLLNFLGVRTDFIDFVADRNPEKQGRFLPGSRIPVLPPEAVAERRPDLLVILPWNLREEIAQQMAAIRGWGASFVVLIPEIRVF
ncbi:MAG TPA: class I SAM-dependent methyltransferase [Stellaceae bacterium]|nr:class I SAM-dependent methyltransferase [Stellaceae bacterium]